MGKAARARALSHFTWQAKARQVRRVYDAILNNAAPLPEVV